MVGVYRLEVWLNRGDKNQTIGDRAPAFQLVSLSSQAGEVPDGIIDLGNVELEFTSPYVLVEDNLESESSTHALSANQGRVLKGFIGDAETAAGEALKAAGKAQEAADKVLHVADGIVDLGVVANFNAAAEKAAERAVTENGYARILLWRCSDQPVGDGCVILQSRWGTHYVTQIAMFEGQPRVTKFRFITTGGNYSVGEWQEIIMATGFEYDPNTRMVRSIGIRPQDKKDLFKLPLGDNSRVGLLRTGRGLEINVTSGTVFISPRTKSGIGVDNNHVFALLGAGMKFDENGGISVDVEALKALLGLNTAAEGA